MRNTERHEDDIFQTAGMISCLFDASKVKAVVTDFFTILNNQAVCSPPAGRSGALCPLSVAGKY